MNHYSFFENRKCEYYPCHPGISEGEFNCLFCYCPLYLTDCGGNYTKTEQGIKDCSACTFPHERKNYPVVLEKLKNENK